MVVAVIVNFRTPDLTIDCLRTIAEARNAGDEISVNLVEGGSGDNSAERLMAAIAENGWGHWVNLIIAPRNGGFAYANNVGIAAAFRFDQSPRGIWLLNSDAYLLPGALKPLLDIFDAEPKTGIVGSRLEYPDGRPQRSAFRFPSVISELTDGARSQFLSGLFDHRTVAMPISETLIDADWIAGASMLIRPEVFSSIGYLDDNYFMYFEETDFCRRALDAGWKTRYEPKSRVVHLVGQSSGVTGEQETKKRRPKYWFESRHRYFLTHFGRGKTLLADLLWLFWRACWHVRQVFRIRKNAPGTPHLWIDFLKHCVLFRGFAVPAFTANKDSEQEQREMLDRLDVGKQRVTAARAVGQL
jgi:N-acetylglucosaminyl-diphospho-decaprenol L-rhamnosyltransferase